MGIAVTELVAPALAVSGWDGTGGKSGSLRCFPHLNTKHMTEAVSSHDDNVPVITC